MKPNFVQGNLPHHPSTELHIPKEAVRQVSMNLIRGNSDVPSQIDASSVRFEVLKSGSSVTILEQNYAYDLVSPEQMYNKYIDKEIELIDKEGKLYSGILLASSGGAVTIRDTDGKVKIVLLGNVTEVSFPALPEGLAWARQDWPRDSY